MVLEVPVVEGTVRREHVETFLVQDSGVALLLPVYPAEVVLNNRVEDVSELGWWRSET